jgi:hypothetical protein
MRLFLLVRIWWRREWCGDEHFSHMDRYDYLRWCIRPRFHFGPHRDRFGKTWQCRWNTTGWPCNYARKKNKAPAQ